MRLYRESGYSSSRFCKEMNINDPILKRWLEKASAPAGQVEVVVEEKLPESLTMKIHLPSGIECEP